MKYIHLLILFTWTLTLGEKKHLFPPSGSFFHARIPLVNTAVTRHLLTHLIESLRERPAWPFFSLSCNQLKRKRCCPTETLVVVQDCRWLGDYVFLVLESISRKSLWPHVQATFSNFNFISNKGKILALTSSIFAFTIASDFERKGGYYLSGIPLNLNHIYHHYRSFREFQKAGSNRKCVSSFLWLSAHGL